MNPPEKKSSGQKSWKGQKSWNDLASPSNLAMAALVGFLFVGQATDWKVLFGRKSNANSSVKFGTPELSRTGGVSRIGAHHSRHARAGSLRDSAVGDPNSEVIADRRSAAGEARNSQSELD